MSETSRPAPAPRRRFGAGALIAVLVVGLAAGGAASWLLQRRGGGHDHGAEKAEAKDKYTCPMHPTIVSDHPGDCPICGMALVKIEPEVATATASTGQPIYYRHPATANSA